MWTRWGLILGLTILVLGVASLPSLAGPTDPGLQAVQAPDEGVVAQSSVDCSACHEDETKQNFPNSDVCSECHVLIGGSYQGSIHSEKTDTFANFDCTECHDPPEDSWFMHFRNGPHGSQNPGISMAPEDTCASTGCHDSFNPNGPIYAEWNESDVGPDALSHSAPAPPSARSEECSSCHGTHEGTFANIEDAPGVEASATGEQPHPNDVSEWRITCMACHDPHTVQQGDNLRGDFESGSQLCAQCHNGPDAGPSTVAHGPIHNDIWQLYSESKFATDSGTHPELECASCHMAGQANTESENARTGHSFDVNTGLLADTDRLDAPASKQCGSCHRDVAGTIAGTQSAIESHLDTATRLQGEANATLADLGLSEDEELRTAMNEGAAWIDLVAAPTVGTHNPDSSIANLRRAIERFESVKSAAYERSASDGGPEDETTATTTEPDTPTSTPTTVTETETPGPGVGLTVFVLVTAMLLAVRRRHG